MLWWVIGIVVKDVYAQIGLSYGNFVINIFSDHFCSVKKDTVTLQPEYGCVQYDEDTQIYVHNWDPYSNSLNYALVTDAMKCEEIEVILTSEEETKMKMRKIMKTIINQ